MAVFMISVAESETPLYYSLKKEKLNNQCLTPQRVNVGGSNNLGKFDEMSRDCLSWTNIPSKRSGN